MEQLVKIFCRNNGATIEVPAGSTLEEIYAKLGLEMNFGPISAHVNNKVDRKSVV